MSSLELNPKKKPIFTKENRLYRIRFTLGKHCFFGNPAILSHLMLTSERTRGFVPPGYPGFTFSET